MPHGFHQLKVENITHETEDAVSIKLQVPGQLASQFAYKPGQFLTFHIDLNGEDVRRSYSICSSPFLDAMPTIAVKEVENGKMSHYMNKKLSVGSLIDVMPPAGKFTVEVDPAKEQNYVLFAGGSGITPIMSIMISVLHKEPKSTITLVYANRNPQSVIFEKQINDLQTQFGGRLQVIHSYDQPAPNWNGLSGFLTAATIHGLLRAKVQNPAKAIYYICGPSGMMKTVKESLETAGIAHAQIMMEYFTAVGDAPKPAPIATEDEDATIPHKIKVEVYGKQHDLLVLPNKTILSSAQDAGLDPPYSCTVGVCTTCRARLKKGKVQMDEREGLSDAEINEGFILTCQSHPLTDDVDLVYE
jgi:ring-1,2-phenylacetyl-CoA epoxidase subunit PaaE